MYCSHFGLHRLPFNNTPDPTFYFSTPDHEEALASLKYATVQRKGFVLVTGEVGAGKTLIGRMFLRQIGDEATTAVITNTNLNGRQLLSALCAEFSLDVPRDASNLELTYRLQDYLLDQFTRDRYVVVLLDEGQNLPDESFEELRMLGNLEADDAKLLQVCILGQPELRDRFKKRNMRQLDQRLFSRFHLKSLTCEQTLQYIQHRLSVAGATGARLFTEGAVAAIHAAAQGTPRVVNQICDNALLTAYGQDATLVDERIIDLVLDRDPSLRIEKPNVARSAVHAPSLEPVMAVACGDEDERIDHQLENIYGTCPQLSVADTASPIEIGPTRRPPPIESGAGRLTEREDGAADVLRAATDRVEQAMTSLHSFRKIESDARSEAVHALDQQLERQGIRIDELSAAISERMRAVHGQLESLSDQTATIEELRQLRGQHQDALTDLTRRCEDAAKAIHALKAEMAEKADNMPPALASSMSDIDIRVEDQTRRLEELRRKLLADHDEISTRISSLSERFAERTELQALHTTVLSQAADILDRIEQERTQRRELVNQLVPREELRALESARQDQATELLRRSEQDRIDLRALEARAADRAALTQLRDVHDARIDDVQRRVENESRERKSLMERFAEKAELRQFEADQIARIAEVFQRIEAEGAARLSLREQFAEKAALNQFQREQLTMINEVLDRVEQESTQRKSLAERVVERAELREFKADQLARIAEVVQRIEAEGVARLSLKEQFAEKGAVNLFQQEQLFKINEALDRVEQESRARKSLAERVVERAELHEFKTDQLTRIAEILQRIEAEATARKSLMELFAEKADLDQFRQEQLEAINGILEALEQERFFGQERLGVVSSELDSLRQLHRRQSEEILQRLEAERGHFQREIDELVNRCRSTGEQLDGLAIAAVQDGEALSQFKTQQEEALSALLSRVENQQQRTSEQFDQLLAAWRRTRDDLETLEARAADAGEVASVREKLDIDVSAVQNAISKQRGELQGLADEVTQRLNRMFEQMNALPADIATARQVDSVREESTRRIDGVIERLDRETDQRQQGLADLNRRWEHLTTELETLAAAALPADTFRAAEQSLTDGITQIAQRIDHVTSTHQNWLKTVIDKLQQVGERVGELENRKLPEPVRIELSPGEAKELARLIETARQERDLIAPLLGQITQWHHSAEQVEDQSRSLNETAQTARQVLQAMKRCNAAMDAKLNSVEWRSAMDRGERLADRMEKATLSAKAVLERMEHVQTTDMDTWLHQRDEARECTAKLTRLLAKTGKTLDERERKLDQIAHIAKGAAGLVREIEAARAQDEAPRGNGHTSSGNGKPALRRPEIMRQPA